MYYNARSPPVLTELTPHPGVQRAGQCRRSVAGWLLWGLLWARLLWGLLRLLVGRHHLRVMGRALLTLLLTHVVIHKVILRRGLVIVVGMLVLMIRLHVVLRRALLVIRMLLLRMVMILMTVVVERCLWGTF